MGILIELPLGPSSQRELGPSPGVAAKAKRCWARLEGRRPAAVEQS